MERFLNGLLNSVAPVWEEPDKGGGGGGGGDDWTPPEGLPADFAGANAEETLSKLLPAYTDVNKRFEGMRTDLAQKPGAPKTPEEYKFEFGDDVKPYIGADFDKNPIAPIARNAAHALGMSNEQTNGFISQVYGEAAKSGLLLPPLDAKAEVATYQKHTGLDDAAVTQRFTENETFGKGLVAQLEGIPDDPAIKAELEGFVASLTDTAAGNILLSALSERLSTSGFKVDGKGDVSGEFFSPEELKTLSADPRIDPRNRHSADKDKRFDEALRKKYDASYAKHSSAAPTDD